MIPARLALKRVASISYGLGQPPKLADEGVPIIRATNIDRGRIQPDGLIFADERDLPLARVPLLDADEVLVVRSGAYTGDSALVTEQWAGSSPGYDLRLKPINCIDCRYLAYSMLGTLAGDAIELAKTRAAQPHLNAEDLGEVPIMLFPIETQRRIADFLDAETSRIDTLIAAKQQMIERLAEARVQVTRAGVVGELTSQGLRVTSRLAWAETLPETWKEAKLTLLAMLGSGHTPSRSHPEWWVDCTIPWVTTGEVAQMRSDRIEYILQTREKISAVGMANSSAVLHPAGTVVLCRTASAGYSAIMATDMAVSQDFATWICGEKLRPRYLLLCLRAMRRDLLDRLATGSTHKTIYMPDIESIRIPVPPLSEQDAIVDEVWKRLSAIDELADNLTREVELLRERRQALITAAVSGELDVT